MTPVSGSGKKTSSRPKTPRAQSRRASASGGGVGKRSDATESDSADSGGERQSQFTLQMRESLHRELARKAFNSGMTMRGYIMDALRKTGLKVSDADLIDRRRRD